MIADAINGAILRLYTALKSEDGQTFVEYSLIGVLVAVVLAAVLDDVRGLDRPAHSAPSAASSKHGELRGGRRDPRLPPSLLQRTAEPMRHIKRSEEGQAMVEFALVAPMLFLILFGIIQFGIAFMHSVALTDAVRAGARKAAVSRSAADPTQATKSRCARRRDRSRHIEAFIADHVTSDWLSGDTVTVDATYPYSDQPPRHRRRLGQLAQLDDRAGRVSGAPDGRETMPELTTNLKNILIAAVLAVARSR